MGHLTGETRKGDNINALMDLMPEGTVMCMTIVVQAQDVLEERFTHLAKRDWRKRGIVPGAGRCGHCQVVSGRAAQALSRQHDVLLTAPDLPQLQSRQRELNAVLLNAGLQPTRGEYEVAPLNGYLRAMPMCFNPAR